MNFKEAFQRYLIPNSAIVCSSQEIKIYLRDNEFVCNLISAIISGDELFRYDRFSIKKICEDFLAGSLSLEEMHSICYILSAPLDHSSYLLNEILRVLGQLGKEDNDIVSKIARFCSDNIEDNRQQNEFLSYLQSNIKNK